MIRFKSWRAPITRAAIRAPISIESDPQLHSFGCPSLDDCPADLHSRLACCLGLLVSGILTHTSGCP